MLCVVCNHSSDRIMNYYAKEAHADGKSLVASALQLVSLGIKGKVVRGFPQLLPNAKSLLGIVCPLH